jgi:hypothetical protein
VNRPETIEETAQLVTQAGGHGIAIRVDHTEPDEVRVLVKQVEAEQGRLDVWVSSVWGGESLVEWGLPLWDMDITKATTLLKQAVLSHVLNAHAALPLLLQSPRGGLIVGMTDGDGYHYRGQFIYDLVKVGVTRIAENIVMISPNTIPMPMSLLSPSLQVSYALRRCSQRWVLHRKPGLRRFGNTGTRGPLRKHRDTLGAPSPNWPLTRIGT